MEAQSSSASFRPCAVLAVYNAASSIEAVVRQTRRVLPSVIVVDDGSTDATPAVLAALDGITVLAHPTNRGKGAALAAGFAAARLAGFTHAITLDADGQHLPDDLPKFLQAIQANPHALVVGVRDLRRGRRPLRRRLLRAHFNFWARFETGRRFHDAQTGFRAYPLAAVDAMDLHARRFDFETEVLVKAAWSGLPIIEVPIAVDDPPGCRSHFRRFRDGAWMARIHALLLAQRLVMPIPLLEAIHRGAFAELPPGQKFRQVLRGIVAGGCSRPATFAACVGLGVCFGILPIWGLQMLTVAALAHRLHLNRLLAVAASNISLPVTIPFILYASLVAGHLIMTGRLHGLGWRNSLNLTGAFHYGLEYLVGAVVLAITAGLAAAAAAYLSARVLLALHKGWRP